MPLSNLPVYKQIALQIKERILSGELMPEYQFPPQIEAAKQYGVSEITIRRAFSELVKEGLVQRVRKKGTFVRSDLGSESKNTIKTIYFAYPPVEMSTFNHTYYTQLIQGAKQTCDRHGVMFKTCDLGRDFIVPEKQDAGYILISAAEYHEPYIRSFVKDEVAIVTVHMNYPHLGVPYVVSDNETGGFLATEHLLSLGHTRIGIILTGKSQFELNQEFQSRFQGYKRALAQYQIEFDPRLVDCVGSTSENELTGYAAFYRLMALPDPPTAIFATTDYKAYGVIKAADAAGVSVPEQLSVVGYDDMFFSQYFNPPLSTVNQNTERMGIRAVELLLENKPYTDLNDTPKVELMPSLVIRDSTGSPAGG